jgi:hypothetical protein
VLQEEIASERPDLDIHLLAINEDGYGPPEKQDAVVLATDDHDLPLLQDTEAADVWNVWAITYRDVVILDAANVQVGVFNLTGNSLGETELTQDTDGDGTPDTTNYETLKALLIAAAGG